MDKQSRKEMRNHYKERPMAGGVYRIRNTVSGRFLIQSASDLNGSKNRFLFSVQMDTCPHFKMQEDWNQYGKNSFVYEVLEELKKKAEQTPGEFAQDIKTLEELWIEKLKMDKEG